MFMEMTVPGKVTFGQGALQQTARIVRTLGVERTVLVTNSSMEELGTADQLVGIVEETGADCCVYSGVKAAPTTESTDAVAELARENDCRLVLGLGGGSCLDVAKVVSVLLTNEGSASAYYGRNLLPNPGVPTVMIPTTAGSGAEASPTARLVRQSDGKKKSITDSSLLPAYTLLDPDLLVSLSPELTASTGMSALANAIEAYGSKYATVFSDVFAEEALGRFARNLRASYCSPDDMEARTEMLLAAYYAGLAAANSSPGLASALAQALETRYQLRHGIALAVMLPIVTEFNTHAAPEQYALTADMLESGIDEGPLRDQALACSEALEELVMDLDLPAGLEELDIEPDDEALQEVARMAMENEEAISGNPREVSLEACMAILRESLL
ncbi:MAG: iron-containing alcohol dehydrogenase [Synergistales bacterium]|nr:iron-containing alcohol dehydrogenase [Synergistales bacterium]